jgi:SAM-dependent methyltransferase
MDDCLMQAMLDLDDHHWWYRGRRKIIRSELDRLALPIDAKVLDAGCGSGRTLDELARFGRVAGVDISPVAVAAARARGHRHVRVAAIEALPFADASFDVVTCLDVIEHTPDDRTSLRELLRVTRAGGVLIVTVPAYPALWSRHDEANDHYRRYRRSTLQAAALDAGWRFVSDTHFNALLLAPAAVVRLWQRSRRRPARSDLALTPPSLDRLLELPLALEARLLARGRRLGAGLSLLAVLRRPIAMEPAPAVPIPLPRAIAA